MREFQDGRKMAEEEEQQQMYNNSSSVGGRFPKKLKQKKIPQRGLGVAQLEKIRLEGQQKQVSVFVPLPHQSSSISFTKPNNIANHSSSSSMFKSQPSIPYPNLDLFIPPPPLPTTTFYGCPLEGSGSGYSSLNMGNPCDLNDDINNLDPGFKFSSYLTNESNLILPPMKIYKKQQQHTPPSSRVNVSFSTSSSSQMEPPSNQSFYSNNYTTSQMLPEEDKMVGMKRSWPFTSDNLTVSSFPYKIPHFDPQIFRLDETSSSCVTSGMFNFEPGNAIFRGSSNSAPVHVEQRGSTSELTSRKGNKEKGILDRDFLTLGPTPTNSSLTSYKAKQPLNFPVFNHQEFAEFDFPPFQVYKENPFLGSTGTTHQQQPPYNFFPSKGQQIRRFTSKSNDPRGEIGDDLDLNLRL